MTKRNKNVSVIILAAGKGTRMKSKRAKVLHEILGRPMMMYVLETARKIVRDNIILVIGYQAEKIRKVVSENFQVCFALQEKPMGTGHAVACALPYLPEHSDQVAILCGDVPLLTAETIRRLVNDHISARRDITLLGVKIDNPKGYGRILFDHGKRVSGVVEESDATAKQRKIKIINAGVYCVKKDFLVALLKKIKPDNRQGEFYFTDIIEMGYRKGKNMGVLIGSDKNEILGINSHEDLKRAEMIMKNRLSKKS